MIRIFSFFEAHFSKRLVVEQKCITHCAATISSAEINVEDNTIDFIVFWMREMRRTGRKINTNTSIFRNTHTVTRSEIEVGLKLIEQMGLHGNVKESKIDLKNR